ncbi:MAG: sigma-54 dependent transcriptional regulator [Candidatus Cryosericum sp.]|nr:sigma-54 dependent transcriptional regulator [bacterium]
MKTQNKLILVVDDEENIRELLRESLEDEGYRVNVAKNGQEAIEKVRAMNPDTVLMDVKMPLMSGMDAFLKIKEFQPDLPVIFLTAFGSSEVAISAMKSGAYDYLTKPFDIDEVRIKVKRALELRELSSMSGRTRPEDLPFINSDELVGQSPLMQEVYKQIGKVASSDATVLILGESGTGKELVAKAIHNNSHRKDKAFVVVNCAAIPENLLESELFGHERGSFTDAFETHIGKFEQASSGTLFLDEIGDMSLPLQAKLLRILQDGGFERVGGHEHLTSSARVIAATNQDLTKLVAERKFREDLFYRLNVITLRLPPLRERRGDTVLLARHFLRKYAAKYGRDVTDIADETLERLAAYDWPGNVRELENVIARAVIISQARVLLPETVDLGSQPIPRRTEESAAPECQPSAVPAGQLQPTLTNGSSGLRLSDAIQQMEIDMIRKALRESGGNKTKAAQILGISRKSLFNKIRDYKLQDKDQ